MKLKTLVVFLSLMLLTSISFASPLTDYSQGKFSLDVYSFPNLDMTADHSDAGKVDTDGKHSNLDFSLTAGLGNNWAVQYRDFRPEGKDPIYPERTNKTKLQEFNVLYKMDQNWSAFVGYQQANYKLYWQDNVWSETKNKDTFQLGLVGSTEIAEKTKLYGIAGFGKDLRNLEVGLAYEIAPSLELNVCYRDVKVDDLKFKGQFEGRSVDSHVKGVGYGLTYKF